MRLDAFKNCQFSWRIISLNIFAFLLSSHTHAAEIEFTQAGNGIGIISIVGELNASDGQHFATLAAQHAHAVVIFNSPGGTMLTGLRIGQIIRLRHYVTLVPDGAFCASACALAWLAGTPRAMQPTGKVGFHSAYVEEGGEKVETGVGNALVGAYLTNLGLSMDAIVYIEQAHPDDITWLDQKEAREAGITVRVIPSAPPGAPSHAQPDKKPSSIKTLPELAAPQTPPEGVPAASLEERGRAFVATYFGHWSETDKSALDYFQTAYPDQVAFYGKPLDRNTVLAGKENYTQRWPVRVYTAAPQNLHIFCNEANKTCAISGTVDWDCRNPAKKTHSSGVANFTLIVDFTSKEGQIVTEDGSVVSRSEN